jgi:hypothetical protein
MDRNEIPQDPHHLGVPSGASNMISEPMVCLAQTVHLSCADQTMSPNRSKRDCTDPCHVALPSSVSKMISEPVVCSVQTVHLSCTDTNIVSKWTEMRFRIVDILPSIACHGGTRDSCSGFGICRTRQLTQETVDLY